MASLLRREFLDRALAAAIAARELEAPIVPAIATAQAALESRFGRSELAKKANNLLGIKAGRSWAGETLALPTLEWKNGDFYPASASWRCYVSWLDCFLDYGEIIGRLPWYADAVDAATRGDARGFLDGLVANPHGPGAADDEPGFATDPKYFDKVWAVATQWGLVDGKS